MKREQPHVVVVSYHALPDVTPGSLRVAWMTSRLAERGWDVTLLTSGPATATADGVRVVSTRTTGASPPPRPGRLRRLWNEVAIPDRYVGWSFVLARRLAPILDDGRVDVVLSTSPPHSTHLALAWLRRRRAFRWVADFRDPWTAPSRYPRSPVVARLNRRMESQVLMACDGIIANTEGNRGALLGAFPSLARERIHVIPNAFDDAMLAGRGGGVADPADITYIGEVYPGMMDRLVDTLRILRARSPSSVPTLGIYGDIDPREWRKLEEAGLTGYVDVRGRVSHEKSLDAMRSARSLLVLLPARESWATCVPSKLYPYLASGRPVLALVPEGDAAKIVREAGAGVALTGGDASATANDVSAFLESVRSGASWPRREDVVRRYASSVLAAGLDAVLSGAMVPA